MRVEAELLDHPKFIRLKSLLGPAALEVLLRIWGHCQSCHRGGHWGLVDPWYVEAVARWSGDSGACMKALRECRFIDVTPDGQVEIHDWNVMNSHMVKAWSNGKKGGRRPRQPMSPPGQTQPETDPLSDLLSDPPSDVGSEYETDPETDRLTQPQPNSEPTGRKDCYDCMDGESVCEHTHATNPSPAESPRASSSAFAETPSVEEVLRAAFQIPAGVGELLGCPSIRPGWAQNWWEWRSNSATSGFQTLRSWRIQMTRDWRKQWKAWELREKLAEKNGAKNSPGPQSVWSLKQRIEALEAQIRDHPGNPDNTVGALDRKKRERPAFDALKRELKELRQKLGGVGGGV